MSEWIERIKNTAKSDKKTIVLPEGYDPRVIEAAKKVIDERIAEIVILGDPDKIDVPGATIINPRHSDKHEAYAKRFAELRARKGVSIVQARETMDDRIYFGMMMVETGDADAFITGLYTRYTGTIQAAKEVIGIRPGYAHFGALHLVSSKNGICFFGDTLINCDPDEHALYDLARLAASGVRFFNRTPAMAMISYSNFGSDEEGKPAVVHRVVERMQKEYPDLAIDGEMQVNFALDRELRDEKYPFTRLKGQDVNTLIFQSLSAANAAYKIAKSMADEGEVIGPIQIGLNKPIHFTDFEADVRDIVNVTAIAVLDATVRAHYNTTEV